MASQNDKKSDETNASGTTGASSSTNVASPFSDTEQDEVLPFLQPPSTEERLGFYDGLPSQPELVGRTSAGIELWPPPLLPGPGNGHDPFLQRPARVLSTIGNHAIRSSWMDIVQPQILAALADLPWTSIDVFRIGLDNVPTRERPVVVWVGLANADTPWDLVARALRACRSVLDAAGLTDVECEMRVSNVY